MKLVSSNICAVCYTINIRGEFNKASAYKSSPLCSQKLLLQISLNTLLHWWRRFLLQFEKDWMPCWFQRRLISWYGFSVNIIMLGVSDDNLMILWIMLLMLLFRHYYITTLFTRSPSSLEMSVTEEPLGIFTEQRIGHTSSLELKQRKRFVLHFWVSVEDPGILESRGRGRNLGVQGLFWWPIKNNFCSENRQ